MSSLIKSPLSYRPFSKKILAKSIAAAVAVTAGDGLVAQEERTIEEVVVTSRQRVESSQDVPVHIQSLTGEELLKLGVTTLEDFTRFAPSVSVQTTSPGQNTIVFRGISDGGGFLVDPTAAIYLDEQPMSLTSNAPDIFPADIARIEALAGPQSTLFGASSQSGTIRIITNKPNLSEVQGDIGVTMSGTDKGDPSRRIDGTVNIPLIEDKLAIRLTGFTSTDGGFIDNVLGATVTDPTSGLGGQKTNANVVNDDINEVYWEGFRAQAKWQINDAVTATLALNHQNIEADGFNDYDPTVGDLDTIKFIEEARTDEWDQISLVIEADLGFAQLVSATSFYDREIRYEIDTQAYAGYFNYTLGAYLGYAVYDFGLDPIGGAVNFAENDAFTQEFRLSGSSDNLQWTAGLFYQEADDYFLFNSYLNDYADTGSFAAWSYYYPGIAPTDSWWLSEQNSIRTDKAVFGEVDWSITDKIDLILGARWYDVEIERDYFAARPASGPKDRLKTTGSDDGFNPKLGLQYNVNDDVMLFAAYSEGYRVGGINRGRGQPTLPQEFDADILENTEFGIKSTFLEGRLQINATVYSMDWTDVQLEVSDPSNSLTPPEPFQTVIANIGDAKVNGFDLDLTALLGNNFEFGFNLNDTSKAEVETLDSYPDVRFPGGVASLGLEPVQDLPYYPDRSWSTYLEYSRNLGWFGGGDGYVRLQHSDTGESLNQLTDSFNSPRLTQGNYAITDLKIGYTTQGWTTQLFINNLSDERGITFNDSFGLDAFFGRSAQTVIRPRNMGVSFRKHF